MDVHIKANDKGAADWPLQLNAEEETRKTLIASRTQKRPGRRDLSLWLFLEDTREIEHVAPSM
jgi:hypothetical protein